MPISIPSRDPLFSSHNLTGFCFSSSCKFASLIHPASDFVVSSESEVLCEPWLSLTETDSGLTAARDFS